MQIARQSALKYKYANLEKVRESQRAIDTRRYAANKAERIAYSQDARANRRRQPAYAKYERLNATLGRLIKRGRRIRQWGWPFAYTPEQFLAHIEARFQPGMTWQNYGHGVGLWEIDHIKPISSFNLEQIAVDDIAATVFALSNLQPLWTPDNMRKWTHG
jgi:hypothetical protein